MLSVIKNFDFIFQTTVSIIEFHLLIMLMS